LLLRYIIQRKSYLLLYAVRVRITWPTCASCDRPARKRGADAGTSEFPSDERRFFCHDARTSRALTTDQGRAGALDVQQP
jgi:hypothetical protein